MAWGPGTIGASEADPEAISWRTDYARGLEEARTRHQLLWIQFTGPWCPNCTRMEQDSFPHPSIRQHARRSFVPVKLRSDENEELALDFDLSGLPATVIVAPSREVIAVRQGYLGPRELDDLLADALARQEARLKVGRRLASANAPDPGASGLGRARASDALPPDPKSQPGTRTKTESRVALSGFCPVSLVSDKRLVQGQSEYTVAHEGRLYRFANPLTLDLFRRDPERYVPVNDGNCPVTQVDHGRLQPGNPRFGALYQGRLFLCATERARSRFLEQPARYAAVDVAERGLCPHCLAQDGLRVPGDPRYELSREGRRYWFPDPSHREAYLAAFAETAALQ
jgi:YHS domain-containing protein